LAQAVNPRFFICGNHMANSGFDGNLGDPWLDRLPGVVAGAFLRKWIERRFRENLKGEVFEYAREHRLHLHLLRPAAEKTRSCHDAVPGCIVFLHGGGFLGGAPSQFYPYAHAVVQQLGMAAALCEFRTFLTHPRARIPFDAVADARRCVRFLQEEAEELGLDRRKVVLAGASSGGHLAAMAALGGSGEDGGTVGSGDCTGAQSADPKTCDADATPLNLAALVLFNPVLDLRFVEGWSQRRMSVWLGSWLLHARYSGAELEAASPVHEVRPVPYPTLIMHGTADKLVPYAEAEVFKDKMLQCGNDCRLVSFPDEGHFFFNWRVSPVNFSRCLGLISEMLSSVGLLPSERP